jgi:hypothetical protein
MRTMAALIATASLALVPSAGLAQDTPQTLRQDIDQLRRDFDALKQQYGERLTALEAKLAQAEAAGAPGAAAPAAAGIQPPPGTAGQAPPAAAGQQPGAPVPPGAEGAGGPTGALPVYGAASAASKIFNPDMAVIGDFLGAAGRNHTNPDPALQMHEAEASFQAIVDPYARADFFTSFSEVGVELEEGYITFTTLPGGLLTRVGKMRAAFGKVNTLHNHVARTASAMPASRSRGSSRTAGSSSKLPARYSAATATTCSSPRSAATSVSSGICADTRTCPSQPTSISASPPPMATTRRWLAKMSPGSSRPISTASTPPCVGGRCSGRSISRSSAVRRLSGAAAISRTGCSGQLGSTSRAIIRSHAAGSPARGSIGRTAPPMPRWSITADPS